jgi:hypothetical protein
MGANMKRTTIILCALALLGIACYAWARSTVVAVVQGAAAAASPAWGGEIATRYNAATDVSTTVLTLTSAVAQNDQVVVAAEWYSAAQTVSEIADSRSNTYTVRQSQYNSSNNNMMVATATAETALQVGDTITITWASANYSNRVAAAAKITGATQYDTSAELVTYGSTNGATATVANNSVQFGVFFTNNKTWSSLASGWTISGSVTVTGRSENIYFYYGTFAVGASTSPGGTLSGSDSYLSEWVSVK